MAFTAPQAAPVMQEKVQSSPAMKKLAFKPKKKKAPPAPPPQMNGGY